MGSRSCMNEACRTTTSSEWKKGWGLKSGGFATLCFKCSFAYEKFAFCETFHSEESGWRECKLCRKLVHCGCIASKALYEYMDFGGIACTSCSKRLVKLIQIPSNIPDGTFTSNGIRDVHPIHIENRIDGDKFSAERLVQLTNIQVTTAASALELHKQPDPVLKTGERSKWSPQPDPVVKPGESSKWSPQPDPVLKSGEISKWSPQTDPVLKSGESSKWSPQTDPVLKSGEGSKWSPQPDPVLKSGERSKWSPQPDPVVKPGESSKWSPQPDPVLKTGERSKWSPQPDPVVKPSESSKWSPQSDPVLKPGESSKWSPVLKTGESSKWSPQPDPVLKTGESSKCSPQPDPVLKTGESSKCSPQLDPVLKTGENSKCSPQHVPMLKTGESSKCLPNLSQECSSSLAVVKTENSKSKEVIRNTCEPLPRPSLNFSLTSPLGSSSSVRHFPIGSVERSEQSKSSIQHGQKMRNNYPKPPKPCLVAGLETSKVYGSQTRVARPPAEGRGRNQLLPRYWPRITDQELQQLSGDLKSNIAPLFEKILSASDAGRIGRLVLPKACAEAYFPTINQSEGIPIRIQDIKGKEWTFQFRFWPNNNSRMYVLEGVTPCITSLQLQAGDTVVFYRRDPGGQLVIGGRKASLVEVKDGLVAAITNGDSPGDGKLSVGTDNLLTNGGTTSDESLQQPMAVSAKKKARNIKNQRLHMHNDDAMELRITWEESQEFLRPAPSAEPTVVMVDGYEFEEFEEPPIIGKRTIFVSRPSGEQEQLAQCDNCAKWRKLPTHVVLSSRWICSDNVWDSKRSSCSAPVELNMRDLDVYNITKSSKKQKISDGKLPEEGESSGLDALATAAVLGDNMPDFVESGSGATTRHPRHRPGCSCIVCIQPPSGKGKHEPTCKCNVCLTVKRRFRTLMMRKKKRESEREAMYAKIKADISLATNRYLESIANGSNGRKSGNGTGHNIDAGGKEDIPVAVPPAAKMDNKSEDVGIAGSALLSMSNPGNGSGHDGNQMESGESSKGQLDLNFDPHREDEAMADARAGISLMTLADADLEQEQELDGVPKVVVSETTTTTCGVDERNVTDEGSTVEDHR